MNNKELIERLRTKSLYKDKAALEIMDLCMEAADAIATLMEECAQLRAENIRWGQVAGEQDRVLDELHAEVNYMQSYNADAEKVIENLCAQLEQMKRERDAAIEDMASVREITPEAEYAINKHADSLIERMDALLHQDDSELEAYHALGSIDHLRELVQAEEAEAALEGGNHT